MLNKLYKLLFEDDKTNKNLLIQNNEIEIKINDKYTLYINAENDEITIFIDELYQLN